jgi:hypothetical protein
MVGESVPAGRLYATYKFWAENNGEHPLTQQKLGTALADRGFRPYRTGSGRGWRKFPISTSHASLRHIGVESNGDHQNEGETFKLKPFTSTAWIIQILLSDLPINLHPVCL